MCKRNKINRYKGFNNVSADITKVFLLNLSFTSDEKKRYLTFAKTLASLIYCFYDNYSPIIDENEILIKLENIPKISILKDYSMLVGSFVTNEVSYLIHSSARVIEVKDFYELLLTSSMQKKKRKKNIIKF